MVHVVVHGSMSDRVILYLKTTCWWWPVLSSVVAWLVIFAALPPSAQNFPLGDDWAFSHGAFLFAQGQGIHYSNWAGMPQLGQWLWAVPFLKLFGMSHFVLRVSTIVVSLIGITCLYDFLRKEGVASRLAGFASSVLAVNPLFFVTQGTFMTDVPSLSFALIALNSFNNSLRRRSYLWLASAFVFSVLGVINRQTLIMVPLIAGIMGIRQYDVRWRCYWGISTLLVVVIGITTHFWLISRPDAVPLEPAIPALTEIVFRSFVAIHLCGLTVLPLLVLVFPSKRWKLFCSVLLLLLSINGYLLLFEEGSTFAGAFPYGTGILSTFGAYSDGLVLGDRDILLNPALRLLLSFIGCVGSAGVVTYIIQAIQRKVQISMLGLFSISQFLIMLLLPSFYDRYVEIVFPGVIATAAYYCNNVKFKWSRGLIIASLYFLVSVGLAHDWLSWNSARWLLGREAIAVGIEPDAIEGGFEWNGWYTAQKAITKTIYRNEMDGEKSLLLPTTKIFFPHVKGIYALSFTQPANSIVLAHAPYEQWLTGSTNTFLLVKSNTFNE